MKEAFLENTIKLFNSEIRVINLGNPIFADELKKQNVKVMSVDWRPPAGGNEKTMNLLDRIRAKKKV